jgi:hypothetical protein
MSVYLSLSTARATAQAEAEEQQATAGNSNRQQARQSDTITQNLNRSPQRLCETLNKSFAYSMLQVAVGIVLFNRSFVRFSAVRKPPKSVRFQLIFGSA